MKTEKNPKMVKLIIDLGYVVPEGNEELIQEAKNCFYEDLMNFVKYNELYDAIKVVDAPNASEKDIPEFLLDTISRPID
jgi:hypothetical protein